MLLFIFTFLSYFSTSKLTYYIQYVTLNKRKLLWKANMAGLSVVMWSSHTLIDSTPDMEQILGDFGISLHVYLQQILPYIYTIILRLYKHSTSWQPYGFPEVR